MDQREMMDLSQQEQFDLDRLAEDLGELPEAPLAMPVQPLETPAASSPWTHFRQRLAALIAPAPVAKAGH